MTQFFPQPYVWLLGTHEERGQLEDALDALSDGLEREAGLRDRTIIATVHPAVVLFFGLLIGSIFVAIYLPIFTLGDAITGL